jgi:limonene-1,2-epoxide hydrolase
MPYTIFSSPVYASLDAVWQVMLEKIENPGRSNKEAQNVQILERYTDGVLRQMDALGMIVKERITIDETARSIRHSLIDNPLFVGKIINTVIQPPQDRPDDPLILTYAVDWEPYNEQGRQLDQILKPQMTQAAQTAVLGLKTLAEAIDPQSSPVRTKETIAMAESFPGTTSDMVKRLFSRGEAFDSEGFITFFTDTPVYQFGNFEICLDKPSIKRSADNFFSKITAVYHDIKMMWEIGDVVFVEMDVTYWRLDGSVITLPCTDIFRVEGDKFAELRIFMDVNPVFDPSIPVPQTSSVFTYTKGQRLTPPNTMRKHFAEHPEGKQRVANGYAPKWSIANPPKWPIGEEAEGLIDKVVKMVEALTIEDWEAFYPYFTNNLYYKVGANDPVYGAKAAANFLSSFYTVVKPTEHTLRGAWQIDDQTVIVEMDAHYRRIADGKHITVPCTDVYRFDGDLIKEWRVYPDVAEVYK